MADNARTPTLNGSNAWLDEQMASLDALAGEPYVQFRKFRLATEEDIEDFTMVRVPDHGKALIRCAWCFFVLSPAGLCA